MAKLIIIMEIKDRRQKWIYKERESPNRKAACSNDNWTKKWEIIVFLISAPSVLVRKISVVLIKWWWWGSGKENLVGKGTSLNIW